jgi:hypothetical protein
MKQEAEATATKEKETGREVGVGEGKGSKGSTSFTIFASNRTVSTESQGKGAGKSKSMSKSKWGLVRSAVATGRIKVSRPTVSLSVYRSLSLRFLVQVKHLPPVCSSFASLTDGWLSSSLYLLHL